MTLIDIQRRFVEIGRLRYGEKVPMAGGKSRPGRLETWRLTSPNLDVIKAAAAQYGGSVVAWEDQWEVVTESATLQVMLPPTAGIRSYSLYYESWTGGGCTRRCDGQVELLSGSPCLCDPDERVCKPTLRVPFFLPDLPGLGVFRLETGGYNAAAELPGMLDLLAQLSTSDRPVRAILRLEQRTSKRRGQTRNYAVPVIDLPYSLDQLRAADLPVLGNGATPQLTSAAAPRPTEQPGQEPSASEQPRASAPSTSEPPASVSPPDLDLPYVDAELERWRAGTHAAMRERIPEGADEHTALHELAAVALARMDPPHQMLARSLNDLTAREWKHVALALRDTPVIQQATGANEDAPVAVASVPRADGGGAGEGVIPDADPLPGEGTPSAPPNQQSAPERFADSPPARLAPAPTGLPSDNVLRERYAWGEQHGFDDEALDTAAIAAIGMSPLEADDATWQAFALTVDSGAITPLPPQPGSSEYKAMAPMERARARAYWAQAGRET